MAFTNMKNLKKKKPDEIKEIPYEGDRYPYGLEINLGEDSLKKLKLGAENFRVKETFQIAAKVKVTSVSVRDSLQAGTKDRVELQITDLDLGKNEPKKSKFAEYSETKERGFGPL